MPSLLNIQGPVGLRSYYLRLSARASLFPVIIAAQSQYLWAFLLKVRFCACVFTPCV